MKLTSDQTQKIITEFNKYSPHICPVCKGMEYQLNETIFEMREFSGGSLFVGGQSSIFPAVLLTCKKCGHTHFFNAILLGVINKEGK
ncbi:MAG: hypothetical protein WA101_00335 [Minisyncoccia bacterium]